MFNILRMHEGCKKNFNKEEVEENNDEKRKKIYNQLRSCMIEMFKLARK